MKLAKSVIGVVIDGFIQSLQRQIDLLQSMLHHTYVAHYRGIARIYVQGSLEM